MILDRILTGGLLTVAVIMLGMQISERRSSPRVQDLSGTLVEGWEVEISTGIRMGSSDALITIVEFMDFQCPFCAAWASRLDSLTLEFPNAVQVVVHHYPLTIHAQALPAAVAAECAAAQGVFPEFYRVAFSQQALFGSKAWRDFGIDAGVGDIKRFEECVTLPADSFPRINYGIELGKRTGVRGTPTIWIDGIITANPTLEYLRARVLAAH